MKTNIDSLDLSVGEERQDTGKECTERDGSGLSIPLSERTPLGLRAGT